MRSVLAAALMTCACSGGVTPVRPEPTPLAPDPAPRSDGSLVIRLEGSAAVYGSSLALGEGDAIYVTGSYADAIDLGAGEVGAVGAEDGFLASYDAEGHHRWSRRFGDAGDDGGTALVWSDGVLGLLGSATYGARVGDDVFVSEADEETPEVHFLARYAGDGTPRGAVLIDEVGPARIDGLATAGCGLVAAGVSTGAIVAGGARVNPEGFIQGLVVCPGDGGFRQLYRFEYDGGGLEEEAATLLLSTPPGLVLAIRARGVIDFGGEALGRERHYATHLVGLGPDGAHRFSRTLGPGAVIDGAVAADGRLLLLLGGENTTPGKIIALDADGAELWSVDAERTTAVAWTSEGGVVTAVDQGPVALVLRDAADGHLTARVPVLPEGFVRDLALGERGAYLLVDTEHATQVVRVANASLHANDLLPPYTMLERPLAGGAATAGATEAETAPPEAELAEPAPAVWSADEQRVIDLVRTDARTRHHHDVESAGVAILGGPAGRVVVHQYRHGRWAAYRGQLEERRQWERTVQRARQMDDACRTQRNRRAGVARARAERLLAHAEATGSDADMEAAERAGYEAAGIEGDPNTDNCRGTGWARLFGRDYAMAYRCGVDRVVIRVQELSGTEAAPALGRVLATHEVATCHNDGDYQSPESEPEAAPAPAPAPPARLAVVELDGDPEPEVVIHETLKADLGIGRFDYVSFPSEERLWVLSRRGTVQLELNEPAEGIPDNGGRRPSRGVRWRLLDTDGDGRPEAVRDEVRFRRDCTCLEVGMSARWAELRGAGATDPVRLDVVPGCRSHDDQARFACVASSEPTRTVQRYDPTTDRWAAPAP